MNGFVSFRSDEEELHHICLFNLIHCEVVNVSTSFRAPIKRFPIVAPESIDEKNA
jgi:hypothetical protein